jgi:hypothetical protein
MKQHLLFLFFIFISIASAAQVNRDSMRLQYNQKTIRLGNRISMNGNVLEKATVQNLMLLSPEATAYYKKYVKSRTFHCTKKSHFGKYHDPQRQYNKSCGIFISQKSI